MSYSDIVAADLRLNLLRLLAASPEYTANEVVLQERLRRESGHTISTDRLRTELAWLDEQGLAVIQKPGGVALATLTLRGADAAGGAAQVPGVARPRPGA